MSSRIIPNSGMSLPIRLEKFVKWPVSRYWCNRSSKDLSFRSPAQSREESAVPLLRKISPINLASEWQGLRFLDKLQHNHQESFLGITL